MQITFTVGFNLSRLCWTVRKLKTYSCAMIKLSGFQLYCSAVAVLKAQCCCVKVAGYRDAEFPYFLRIDYYGSSANSFVKWHRGGNSIPLGFSPELHSAVALLRLHNGLEMRKVLSAAVNVVRISHGRFSNNASGVLGLYSHYFPRSLQGLIRSLIILDKR